MVDDLSQRGQADRIRITLNERHEINYWTQELGVDEARLRQLVHNHGVMGADIRKVLGKA